MRFEDLVKFPSRPYPFYYSVKDILIIALIIFFMSLLFNYFFRPFDVYTPEHKMDYFWISLLHSLTPLILFLACGFSVMGLVKTEEKWTVGKEIIFISSFLLLVGIGQFLMRDLIYDNPDNWSWRYFFEEIRNTFLVGTLFVLILVPLNYNRLHERNAKRAKDFRPASSTKLTNGISEVSIEAQVKSDNFSLSVASFMYARAEGNYVEVFLKKEDGIEKRVKRMTIKNLYAQLVDFPQILKVHRSYLVNLYQIEKISGNAQGYRLNFQDSINAVPVSRTMIPTFEERYKKL